MAGKRTSRASVPITVGIVVLAFLVVLLAVCAVGIVVVPAQTASLIRPVFPQIAASLDPSSGAEDPSQASARPEARLDADLSTASEEAAYREAHKGRPAQNPLVAQCTGVDLRSPIAPADLTAVLFHQASYDYALRMTTALPEANMEVVDRNNPARVNRDQTEGEWLDAEAMHLWRTSDSTEMDTSIDIGAPAGTTLRSPVTGTVVLVKDYLLYEEVPDIEIHIAPEGRPDLDVVLIHTYDPLVKAGDTVEAGITEISHVRDIATPLVDVQLYFYTPEDDPGNHTHVQVNDANHAGYREKKLEGAITLS